MPVTYPSDADAKKFIVEVGSRMYAKNFVVANDGNISCKVDDDTIWTTPTGVSKGFLIEDELVKMRLDGSIIHQGKLAPSSEVKMHIRIYHEKEDVLAVCHAHPPVATSFAIAGIALDKPIYSESIVSLGVVPCVPYATPGSERLPEALAPFVPDYNAVLLANHGVVSWGKSLLEAWFRLEAVEQYALITLYTRFFIGKANCLSADQVAELIKIREKSGITSGGVPKA